MQIIKKIFTVVLSLIAFLLIAAIFIKKNYVVEKTITINKPALQIFNYVKYLKNQNEYSKWALMDTAMKKTFTGTDATVGFTSAWQSNNKNVGQGEQEIKKIEDGKKIDYEIRFKKPFESLMNSFLSTDSISTNLTMVKWNIHGVNPYPINLMNLFMNKMVGGDIEIGLANLKNKMEN